MNVDMRVSCARFAPLAASWQPFRGRVTRRAHTAFERNLPKNEDMAIETSVHYACDMDQLAERMREQVTIWRARRGGN